MYTLDLFDGLKNTANILEEQNSVENIHLRRQHSHQRLSALPSRKQTLILPELRLALWF